MDAKKYEKPENRKQEIVLSPWAARTLQAKLDADKGRIARYAVKELMH